MCGNCSGFFLSFKLQPRVATGSEPKRVEQALGEAAWKRAREDKQGTGRWKHQKTARLAPCSPWFSQSEATSNGPHFDARLTHVKKSLRAMLPDGKFSNLTRARTRIMRAIRNQGNKTTELKLRLALVRAGVKGWVMHPRELPGRPDFVFPAQKLAIFVDGCYWHGCKRCGHIPRTNREFWNAKVQQNKARDRAVVRALSCSGYHVLRFWEHQLSSRITRMV